MDRNFPVTGAYCLGAKECGQAGGGEGRSGGERTGGRGGSGLVREGFVEIGEVIGIGEDSIGSQLLDALFNCGIVHAAQYDDLAGPEPARAASDSPKHPESIDARHHEIY